MINILSKVWGWIKYNVLFCFFDEAEETRKKHLEELQAFLNRTPFSQADSGTQDLEDKKDFLPAFKALSQEIQDGIMNEMIVILKTEASGKEDDRTYKKRAEELLKDPYVPNKEIGDKVVVLEAINKLDIKLRVYESY